MTRFARGGAGNKKRPEEATPWNKLKQDLPGKPSAKKRLGKRSNVSVPTTTARADGDLRNKQREDNDSEQLDKQLQEVLVRTKRSEERRLKRIKKKTSSKVCYHCRQPGHEMSECPQMTGDVEQGTGICFRCGSTEHKSAKCAARNIPEQTGKRDLPFAKCFICGESGHLARACPDNPRGLYPNGGCCKHCGSVEHHQWQCPNNTALGESEVIQVSTMDNHTSADLEVIPRAKVKGQPPARKGPKIVKF
ncbi:zinc finger CCHC domain-containing protein 9-like [Branchiostoma lanceolatum]|uniref:zinc finger CCHC domain-containing protein 9-like n=1 Tax=Branchiostoma lanceolatum TaxID=7740 RepID=UPI0034551FE6